MRQSNTVCEACGEPGCEIGWIDDPQILAKVVQLLLLPIQNESADTE